MSTPIVPVIESALQAGTALLQLIDKLSPSEQERIERLRARAPWRAIQLQKTLFNRRLKNIKRIRKFMKREQLTEQQLLQLLQLHETLAAQ